MFNIDIWALRSLHMRQQCLAPRLPKAALNQAVKTLVGVQAQLPSAMELSLCARLEGLTLADVDAARQQDRSIVRTWCMRGSMHLLAADDVDWLLSSLSPAIINGGWRWLEKRAGLERGRAEQVIDQALRVLKGQGPLTRPELMNRVAKTQGAGVKKAAAGIVWLNGLLGRVCFGPDKGVKPTYVALEDWLDRPIQVGGAPDRIELARRYLQGYGPAEPEDLAAWWGMPLTEARAAWEALQDALVEVQCEGRRLWMLASQFEREISLRNSPMEHAVRLLPAFDVYLLGYKWRDFAVMPEHQAKVFHGGQLVPVVLVDGLAAGIWHYERRGERINIEASPFSSFDEPVRELIAAEAQDIGRFYGLTPVLKFKAE
jgi:hypothetical protein